MLRCQVLIPPQLTPNVAIQTVDSPQATVLWSVKPVLAHIFGILFLHEQLSPQIIIGFVLVFTAVIVSVTGSGVVGVENEQEEQSHRSRRVVERS